MHGRENFTAISCSKLMCFEDSHERFKDYNLLFILIEAIFLLTMFPFWGPIQKCSQSAVGVDGKKVWKMFCFISLWIILTNKAPPPSEDGGRIGNSHPSRAKNKHLLTIWTIWLLETAAAWSLTPHERGGYVSLAGPRDTRIKIKLTFWKGTLRNLCLWFLPPTPLPFLWAQRWILHEVP